MFTFKAPNPNRSVIRGIVAIIIGGVLISVPGLTLNTVIKLLGGLLIADGLINFLIRSFSKTDKNNPFIIVPRGTSNIIFGIILLSFPTFMVEAFVFLIGFILIIAGGSQLISQLMGRSVLGFSWLVFSIGLVAFVSGLVMLSKPFKSAEALLIFFGVITVIYGVGQVLWSFRLRKHMRNQPKQQQHDHTVDAEYEEVE